MAFVFTGIPVAAKSSVSRLQSKQASSPQAGFSVQCDKNALLYAPYSTKESVFLAEAAETTGKTWKPYGKEIHVASPPKAKSTHDVTKEYVRRFVIGYNPKKSVSMFPDW